MIVYKFGGASVKDAEAVKNVANIVKAHESGSLIIIVSAMGKTTNQLEKLTEAYYNGKPGAEQILKTIEDYHLEIARQLFENENHFVYTIIERTFYHLYYYIKEPPGKNYNFEYDRIVSTGELISTHIVSEYLNSLGFINRWFHAPDLIITDINYRDARVDWLKTERAISDNIGKYINKKKNSPVQIAITQGFIGGTTQGFITTLGREGSDYTAAIFAYTLQAKEVVIWKDVEGLLNADPKKFPDTVLIKNISYQEAIELSYFGATVIHPKTLKPLLKKNIPLKVKSFYYPQKEGTIINHISNNDNALASYIFKSNQFLLSIFPKDFSFIAEQNLSRIFSDFARAGIKINLMQNSALSFSVCFDQDKIKTPALLKNLGKIYNLKYNTDVELITIRHYDKANPEKLLIYKKVLMEQKSRTTLQWVVKNAPNVLLRKQSVTFDHSD